MLKGARAFSVEVGSALSIFFIMGLSNWWIQSDRTKWETEETTKSVSYLIKLII